MWTRWLFPLGLVITITLACVTKPQCAGCHDASGSCLDGTTQQACGRSGEACQRCTADMLCSNQVCQPAADAGPGVVPCASPCTGCCSPLGCVAGAAISACGRLGEACQDCGQRHSTCQNQGCVYSPDGGGPGGGTGGGGGAGGGGGTTPDAGTYADGGTLSRFWDGGACTLATDCPCFSSDDCAPSFYCHSRDTSGLNVFCIPGARGDGGVGDVCAGEADCRSALCTDSTSAGKRCSALCDVAAECAPTLPRCTYIGFGVDRSICAP